MSSLNDEPTEDPARRLWHLIEPIHAVTYFADPCRDAFTELGLAGFWMGYFAGRAAPMGAVGPAVVEAAFMNFAPTWIHRALPDAWTRTTPETVINARAAAAAIALRQIVPAIDEHARRIVPLLDGAARAAECSGRVLASANQALEPPDDPVARLWQLTTTLREHRGDGHTAALVACGVSGRDSLLLAGAAGISDPGSLQAARGWTDAAWFATAEALRTRGWLTDEGGLTAEGALVRVEVERRTDAAAWQPYRDGLTETGLELLINVLRGPARAILAAGLLPFPNPIGLPDPRSPEQ